MYPYIPKVAPSLYVSRQSFSAYFSYPCATNRSMATKRRTEEMSDKGVFIPTCLSSPSFSRTCAHEDQQDTFRRNYS